MAVLRRYATAAALSGARATTFVATEPLRRTPDAARVCAEVERETGLPLHVLGHDEEAYLTLIGVAGGRRSDRAVLIVDVGGGSSEIVRAGPDRDPIATGLRLGAGRLTAAHVTHDPPTATEVDAMRAAAAGVLADAPDDRPGAVVAVGGTASNVLRVLGRDDADDVVSRADLRVALDRLLGQTRAEAVDRHGVRPTRARILVAGAVILDAVLDRYGVDRLRVSEAGIREGTVLAVAKAGIGWRDRLRRLAGGRD